MLIRNICSFLGNIAHICYNIILLFYNTFLDKIKLSLYGVHECEPILQLRYLFIIWCHKINYSQHIAYTCPYLTFFISMIHTHTRCRFNISAQAMMFRIHTHVPVLHAVIFFATPIHCVTCRGTRTHIYQKVR
jgi:hypothetical protein